VSPKRTNPGYESITEAFACLLRETREAQHLSMSQVAQRAGLSQQMVSYVEIGLRGPTLDTVLRLGHALNVNPTDLINRAIKETQTDNTPRRQKTGVRPLDARFTKPGLVRATTNPGAR
jgi:transcriptional regulator with XRE-family HTH domain